MCLADVNGLSISQLQADGSGRWCTKLLIEGRGQNRSCNDICFSHVPIGPREILLPEFAKAFSARLLILAFIAGFSEKLVPEAVIHHAISRQEELS